MSKVILFIVLSFILFIYSSWFSNGPHTATDFKYIFANMYDNRPLFPDSWNPTENNGLGSFASPLQWVNTVYAIPIYLFGKGLSLQWEYVSTIGFFIPFLVGGFLGSYSLGIYLFKRNIFSYIVPLMYMTNTFVLMMIGGGQLIAVGLAYATLPWFILAFLRLFNALDKEKNGKKVFHATYFFILASFFLILFDLRYVFMAILVVAFYCVFAYLFIIDKHSLLFKEKKRVIVSFISIILSLIALHSFWLIPTVLYGQNTLQEQGAAYSSSESLAFFSFAKFENSISLLHPNWPENVFGKIQFMRPAFILFPLIAFSSLLFLSKNKNRESMHSIFWVLLALLGAFLAKGVNEPFGFIYTWLFDYVPGFSLFRDPSKWYALVALSYSVLIPFTISAFYDRFKQKKQVTFRKLKISLQSKGIYLYHLVFVILIGLYIYLLTPIMLGMGNGTFTYQTIPPEFKTISERLDSQNIFFRTLWYPQTPRFTYATNKHPAISANVFFDAYDPQAFSKVFEDEKTCERLRIAGVKYIIIPNDVYSEIFTVDYIYSNMQKQSFIESLQLLSCVSSYETVGQSRIYELDSYKDKVWSSNNASDISYAQSDLSSFKVVIKNAKKDDMLVLSESYHPEWKAYESSVMIPSDKYKSYNSFILPKDGNYEVDINFEIQKWVTIGTWISILSYVVFFIITINIKRKV